jgi:hypothetical protein
MDNSYPGEHRLLRARVYLDTGESGYVKVQFDDVYQDGHPTKSQPESILSISQMLISYH